MYVIKATQKAPSYSHGNKKLLAASKCCSGSILAQKCCRKNKRQKASNNPPCIKTIKHNKFHNVKSVAYSSFAGSVPAEGKLPKPTENDMRGTWKSCRINAGGILEKKKMRGSMGEIKPPLESHFSVARRESFLNQPTDKNCLLRDRGDLPRGVGQCGL